MHYLKNICVRLILSLFELLGYSISYLYRSSNNIFKYIENCIASCVSRSKSSILGIFLIIGILSGCASISTEIVCGNVSNDKNNVKTCKNNKVSVGDGIIYYLPKRDIRVNITVASPDETTSTSSSTNPPSVTGQTSSSKAISNKSDSSLKKITVNIANNYSQETLPDQENVFLLRYNKNYIGANNMAIGVNSYGLLSITHADTINKINEIAANIAADVAAVSLGGGFAPQNSTVNSPVALKTNDIGAISAFTAPADNTAIIRNVDVAKCEIGSYSILIDPKEWKNTNVEFKEFCGIVVELKTIFNPGNNNSNWIDPAGTFDELRIITRQARNALGYFPAQQYRINSLPGIFYKQDLPYIISICKYDKNLENSENKDKKTLGHKCPDVASRFVAISPNESKIFFAPITETFFTDNTSDITLVNGVVNTLKENTDSELLALSKIPSSVLGAYTNAVGQIFSSFSTVATNKNLNMTNELLLLMNTEKLKRCQAAIVANPLIGKTGETLATAQSNIQSACATN